MNRHRLLIYLAVLYSVLGTPYSALCQEVQWRTDYDAARREAVEKSRPLVIDFSTENCFFCKKLDATTFRDPAVIKLMNERFIPLKIDANRETALAQALNIRAYPTLVLGSCDGAILDSHEGFQEAPAFLEFLQRNLAKTSDLEWMVRDYQIAAKAIAASDYARAIALLKSITEDNKTRPVQVKARQLLQDLEQQALGRLTRARQLVDKGQHAEAMDTITELVRVFAGTQAATDGGKLLSALANSAEIKEQQRLRRARELLAQAREDYRTQQYLCCLDRCEVLAAGYADLPEGAEGMQLSAEIRNNPEWLQRACDNLSDRLGTLYLSLAETWLKKGQPQQAVVHLERVVQSFPGTRQAEAAQAKLAQIQEQPTRPVNFKKP